MGFSDSSPICDTPGRLSERLVLEGQKTVEFFRQLTPAQFGTQVYSDGSAWTVGNILAHFVSAEFEIGRLIRNVLSGGMGAPEEFDLDKFNEHEVMKKISGNSTDLLEQFQTNRRSNARLVADLTADDLNKSGRHPYLGVIPLEEIIKMIYRHNQIHQRDIRRLLKVKIDEQKI